MADLNTNWLSDLATTSHPVQAETPGDAAQQAAQIAQTQQQTQLGAQQTQGLAIQNQISQNQLKTNQLIAQGMTNVAKTVQAGNPPTALPTSQSSQAISANTTSTANTIPEDIRAPDPNEAPPGQINVLPAGVDPSWTIDKQLNGYRDADGDPVPHKDAPPVLPNGGLNYHSTSVMDAAADDAVAHGADPYLVAQWRMEAEQKAVKLDQDRVGVYKDTADAAKAQADAAEANQRAAQAQRNHVADTIDADLRSPNPTAGLTQTLTAYQNVGDHLLTSLGADQNQLNSPNRAAYVQQFVQQNAPAVTKAAQAIQQQSPAFQKNQETMQGALHIVPGYLDPSTGNYIPPTAVKGGPNGVSVVDLQPKGPGGNTAGPTPLQAQVDAVGQYRQPLSSVPSKLRPAVQQALAVQYPDNDQTQFVAKNKALTDYTSGQDHQKVVAIQTAYNHLDQLQTAMTALNSGNTQVFNGIAQTYERQTGSPLPTNAQAIKLVALDEVSKALTGASGGEGDRETAQALVDLKASPIQASDAISQLRGLMQSKVGPLQDAAKSAGLTDKQTQAIFGNLYRTPGPSGRVGDEGSPNAATSKTGSANQPLAGQTPTAAQIFTYMQKNGLDHDTAITKLKALGANL